MGSEDIQAFDTQAFRRALGMFATGIAVVTALTPDGRRIGLTINSFNSVSLDPPLILWSLARSQSNRAEFERCASYAVNVLAADQQTFSQRFASRETDKFSGIEGVTEGREGAPLLPGCLARFECHNLVRYDGGDHLIFVGKVVSFDRREGEPLLYYAGGYRTVG